MVSSLGLQTSISTSAAEGEQRHWVHLAIERFTDSGPVHCLSVFACYAEAREGC
jgi:hypothetical protein